MLVSDNLIEVITNRRKSDVYVVVTSHLRVDLIA